MTNMKLRCLSFIFLSLVPALSIVIIFLVKSGELFAPFGLSKEDSLGLSIMRSIPIGLFFPVLWHRYVLKVAFPSLKQALFHPRNVKEHLWFMLLIIMLYVVRGLIFYYNYGNSIASLFSIGLSLASLYAFVIILETTFHVAKDEKTLHPFRRKL